MLIELPPNSLLGHVSEPSSKVTSSAKRVIWRASDPSGAVVSENLSANPSAANAVVVCASHEYPYVHDIELNGIDELKG